MKNKLLTTLVILLPFLYMQLAFALDPATISNIYIFGDSLSDDGYQNSNSAVPAGKEPTYTTPGGHVWGYYLGQALKKPVQPNNLNPPAGNANVNPILDGNDYAAGGATTTGQGISIEGKYNPPSVAQQITNYLNQHNQRADPKALYIIWVGANNAFQALNEGKTTQLPTIMDAAAQDIANQVAQLYRQGAKHVLVITLPDLSVIPLLAGAGYPKTILDMLSRLSFSFNNSLNSDLAYTGTSVKLFDAYTVFQNIVHDKELTITVKRKTGTITKHFSLTNVTDSACDGSASTQSGNIINMQTTSERQHSSGSLCVCR